jgi:hypothetical protein
LNPLPIIHGAPTPHKNNDLTGQRHKRQIIADDNIYDDNLNIPDLNEYNVPSEPEIIFEGLLG